MAERSDSQWVCWHGLPPRPPKVIHAAKAKEAAEKYARVERATAGTQIRVVPTSAVVVYTVGVQ